jgi:hypothetical protein
LEFVAPGQCIVTIILEGVRRDDSANMLHASASALAREGRVAYRVTIVPPSRGRDDKRTSERRRSRLRSAKLLDSNNRFLCECLVRDRSSTGLRLTLVKAVGLPNRCRLFDDETGEVSVVVIVWRRESTVGARYCATVGPAALSRAKRAALRGRYYAIPD